jgi:hypothetical protein
MPIASSLLSSFYVLAYAPAVGMESDVGSKTDFVLASLGHYTPEEYRDNIMKRQGTVPSE